MSTSRENAKNCGFLTGPTPGCQKFSLFLSKTLVWGSFGTLKTLTACPPDITPKKCLYTTVLVGVVFFGGLISSNVA